MIEFLWYLFWGIVLIPLVWIRIKLWTGEKENIAAVMSERHYLTAQNIRHDFIATFNRNIDIHSVELCLKELIYSGVVQEKVLAPFSDLTPGYKLKDKDGVSNTPTPIPTQGCYA